MALSLFHLLEKGEEMGRKPVPLSDVLAKIQDWSMGAPVELPPDIVKALELDDYINATFSHAGKAVDLYIGYYLSADKIGSAHDPLVCFPGQGWSLGNHKTGTLRLRSDAALKIHYSSMIAEKGDTRNLILYWFQAYDTTASGTFLQKIYNIWQKFKNRPQESAFVRLVIPFSSESNDQEARATALAFMDAFYPTFLQYIQGQSSS